MSDIQMEIEKKNKVKIKGYGSGGLFPFYIGVGAYLQDHYDVNYLDFETSSGSSTMCIMLIYNFPILLYYDLWCDRIIHSIKNKSLLYVINNFFNMIEGHNYELINLKMKNKTHNHNIKHTIQVTNYKTNTKEKINKFIDKRDYVRMIVASSYFRVPFLFESIKFPTRNKEYCDGALDKYWYMYVLLLPFIFIKNQFTKNDTKKVNQKNKNDNNNNNNLITIKITLLKTYPFIIRYILLIYYTIIGLYTKQNWMVKEGYEYAHEYLKPKLDKYNIPPRPDNQIKSNDKYEYDFKLNFHPNTKTFF